MAAWKRRRQPRQYGGFGCLDWEAQLRKPSSVGLGEKSVHHVTLAQDTEMQQEKLSVAMSVSPQRIYANLIKSFFGGLWRTTAEFSQQQFLFRHFFPRTAKCVSVGWMGSFILCIILDVGGPSTKLEWEFSLVVSALHLGSQCRMSRPWRCPATASPWTDFEAGCIFEVGPPPLRP